MIVGNGMMAKAFQRYAADEEIMVFASGVSNSNETDPAQFLREKGILLRELEKDRKRLFMYFSTCSIEDRDVAANEYVRHKLAMEQLIRSMHSNHLILRLPQVVGKSANRTTIANFLHDRIAAGEHFTVWKNAVRYLIDVDDVVTIARSFIDSGAISKRTINITLFRYTVPEIVRIMEEVVGKRAVCSMIDKGTPYRIDTNDIAGVFDLTAAGSAEDYLYRVFRKYYV